jgi:hypothetical protein
MATNIKITSIKQLQPISAPAQVQIDFIVVGILPDIVQIFASGVSDQVGGFVDKVEINSPENTYTTIIKLAAGTAFFVSLCPRTVTNGVLDDKIDDQPWETFCTRIPFTTQAPSSPPAGVSAPSTPTITGMTSRQFTLRERSSFFISWSSEQCDNYHLSWRLVKSVPGSTNSGNVQEIKAPSNFAFTSRIFDSQPGEIYEAQVQACRHVDIGNDACSSFSAPTSLDIPENTRSLRQFLLLSQISLPAGVRGIGMGPNTVLGPSIRRLLRV